MIWQNQLQNPQPCYHDNLNGTLIPLLSWASCSGSCTPSPVMPVVYCP